MPRRLLPPAVASLLLLAGCGSQPPQSPPTGVDGLVVPTPSPDPSDFVAGVDNPWLPLAPGTVWRYAVSDGSATRKRTVTVLAGDRRVAGVATTVVRTVDRRTSDSYYAQDRAGNVWLFGSSGPGGWIAGEDDAEAGLVAPAAPRVGDGFVTGAVDDRPVAVDSVVATDATYAGRTGLLQIERVEPGTGRTSVLLFASGQGLVSSTQVSGGSESARLVSR